MRKVRKGRKPFPGLRKFVKHFSYDLNARNCRKDTTKGTYGFLDLDYPEFEREVAYILWSQFCQQWVAVGAFALVGSEKVPYVRLQTV